MIICVTEPTEAERFLQMALRITKVQKHPSKVTMFLSPAGPSVGPKMAIHISLEAHSKNAAGPSRVCFDISECRSYSFPAKWDMLPSLPRATCAVDLGYPTARDQVSVLFSFVLQGKCEHPDLSICWLWQVCSKRKRSF